MLDQHCVSWNLDSRYLTRSEVIAPKQMKMLSMNHIVTVLSLQFICSQTNPLKIAWYDAAVVTNMAEATQNRVTPAVWNNFPKTY